VASNYRVYKRYYWAFSATSSLTLLCKYPLQESRNLLHRDKNKYSISVVGILTPIVDVECGMQYQILCLSAFELARNAF
jgi:hypothetical protein